MKNLKSKSQNLKKHQGFTLIEILTALFLGTIIIIVSYTVFLMSYKAYQKHISAAELTQNARISMERMSRDIRQASMIITPLPIDPDAGTPPSEIEFQDGHVTTQIQYVRYYLSGTDLHREVSHYAFVASAPPEDWVTPSTSDGGGNLSTKYTDLDQIKAEKISSLQFWGNAVITIHLNVSDTKSSYTFETKVLARNAQ
ncbi:MAG: prepilin-type N-terminal cleavage/methylation domain-containing protein [Patescibacteria group bacterium]|jgi:prepilin-type N-terminal cleavage/methylation domain-containing protein